MKIRTQLGALFGVVIAVIFSFGFVGIAGGGYVVRVFSDSLEKMEGVSQIRSLQVLLARQRASLDGYILVGSTPELQEFERFSRLIQANLDRMDQTLSSPEFLTQLIAEYNDLMLSARQVIDIYPTNKSRAVFIATDELLPKVLDFLDSVNQAEVSMSQEVQEAYSKLRRWMTQGGFWFLGVGALVLLIEFLFAFNIFRSLSRSLKILQEGTSAFGQGKFDYQIELNTRDELGALASSFNEMAESIRHLEAQTIHMHRMSAIGQLAGGVAHEVNNPLTGVLGQAQLLLAKFPEGDARREHIEKIERAAIRCKKIVRSLLDYSRRKEVSYQDVSINHVVESTLDLCSPDLQGQRISIVNNLDRSIPMVMGSGAQLQQVFLNIVTNATQSMGKGGTLTVESRLADPLPGTDTPCVEVVFKDTGTGIESEHLAHLFEPFFTTKEIGQGTGLGLSVSMSIVRNHGGDIQAKSAGKGQGAEFHVFVPVTKKESEQNDTTSPAEVLQGTRYGSGTGTVG